MFYIIGLGNPGDEYLNTRHNTGRDAILRLAKDLDAMDFVFDPTSLSLRGAGKKSLALVSKGKIGKEQVTLILPETFMNKSGDAVSHFIKPKLKTSKKGLDNLIVVHDDIDLGLGTLKISYNKGTGGHRGLDSVAKAVKTLEFVRVRVGISPVTPKGKVKKPQGEDAVVDFILGKWKPSEADIMKKNFKKASEAIQTILTLGRDKAMNLFN